MLKQGLDRHEVMSRIRSKDTKPELAFRKALFRRGFRYRLYVKRLPGTPDLVLRKYRAVVFVNGCFWHAHSCKAGRIPETNREYWAAKLSRNAERDREACRQLLGLGWNVLIVWECQLKKARLQETVDWASGELFACLLSSRPSVRQMES